MSFFRRIFNKGNNGEVRQPGPEGRLTVVPPYRRFSGTRIWAVGGGKGGVGKSMAAANLGILLSSMGNRVLLVDADLGAANLHTFLGLEGSRLSLSSFLKSEVYGIEPLVTRTNLPNLELISGAKDSLDVADLNNSAIERLKEALSKAAYDYVVLDIGPGTTSNMLDLFLMSDEGVLLTTPEPTSIENTYRFLKCLFLRRIRNIINSEQNSRLKDQLHMVFNGNWSSRIRTIADILHHIKELDGTNGEMLGEFMGKTSVSLVINQTRRPQDEEIGPSMERACRDYFGIEIGFLGNICYEESVADSIRFKKPLVVHYSQSGASRSIDECMKKLVGKEQRRSVRRASN